MNCRILLPLLIVFALAGCVSPSVTMDPPSGFALFDDTEDVRAISPEGVVIRARSVPNEPEQTLDFWAEALERHMTESGYLLVDREDFTAASEPGVLMEWLAPVNQEDWIYLTAISVEGARVAVVESAGPAELYGQYRDAIRSSLRTLVVEGADHSEE